MSGLPRSRIALGNFHYVRHSFDYFLDSVRRLNIPNIELWAAAPHFCLDILNAGSLRGARDAIGDRGLKVVCLTPEQCSYPVNIAAPDEALRRRSVDNFFKAIDAAAELRCPRVLVTAGCGYFDRNRREAWSRSVESMKAIAAHAKSEGVSLVYEPLSVYSSNIVNDAKQLAAMLDELSDPNIFGMVDTGQMALIGESIEDYPRLLGDRLAHVHLVDATPNGHLALGDGTLPLGEYIDALESGGYGGFYSFEITDPSYRLDPAAADEKGLRWLAERGRLAD